MHKIHGKRLGVNEIPYIHQCLNMKFKKLETPGGWLDLVDLSQELPNKLAYVNDFDWDFENRKIKDKNTMNRNNGFIENKRYFEEEEFEENHEIQQEIGFLEEDIIEEENNQHEVLNTEIDLDNISSRLFGISLCYHVMNMKNWDLPHSISIVSQVMNEYSLKFDDEIFDSTQKGMIISDVWKKSQMI